MGKLKLAVARAVILLIILLLLYVLSGSGTYHHYYLVTQPASKHQGFKSECSLPQPMFKAWKDGLVTILEPEVPRNCPKLFSGNVQEIRKQKGNVARWRSQFSDRDLLKTTANCSWVKERFSNNLYSTVLEKSFPIAFTFLIHDSPQQVVRLLKLLYRPHNQYCIAPDLKSSAEFIDIFRNIANCLDNVHIVSKIQDVRWGHKSIMESQMQMYWDLLNIRETQEEHLKWKYVINLCGKELPLNSNYDIVSKLMKLNGTSSLNARKIYPDDFTHMGRLREQKIPHGVPYYKSLTYMSLSFQFVHFLFNNSTAVDLFNFFKKCNIPEEHYYSTVYMIPDVPGGYNSKLPRDYYFVTSNYFWRKLHYIMRVSTNCGSGKIVHDICIVDVGDIQRILAYTNFGKNTIFHNKYFMERDHVIMDCMEERIINKNKVEYENDCRKYFKPTTTSMSSIS